MLSLHPVLQQSRRPVVGPWRDAPLADQVRFAEYLLLASCGIAAATMVLLLDFNLRLPGHAILRAVFPMALGMACVPRHGAGSVMGLFAAGTWGVFSVLGRHSGFDMKGLGATTSLLCTGPLLDVALRQARQGWRLYAAFVLAGLASNLTALAVQSLAKFAGWDSGGGRSLSAWLAVAAVTYPVCGVVAGWFSALCWFRWKGNHGSETNV
jgi:hypothetical protein